VILCEKKKIRGNYFRGGPNGSSEEHPVGLIRDCRIHGENGLEESMFTFFAAKKNASGKNKTMAKEKTGKWWLGGEFSGRWRFVGKGAGFGSQESIQKGWAENF